ncbi:hypothetical protein [Parvibaculum sp.]|jgi:hypothetical protein|nr:hypothetical protein [Parvibaculum sp.]|tara:strand:- start:1162 stop:1293 length:132 start_codon:yes stop_codon:yes gene_type:complete
MNKIKNIQSSEFMLLRRNTYRRYGTDLMKQINQLKVNAPRPGV